MATLRDRSRMGSLVAAGAATLLLRCGGGTEVAPANPVVEGPGSAAVRLGGNDLGATELVAAGIAGEANVLTPVVDEQVTFSAGAPSIARLLHGGVAPNPGPVLPSPLLTDLGGSVTYTRAPDAASCGGTCDYWVLNAPGVLERSAGSTIPTGQPLLFDYTYNARLLEVSVGLTFSAGSNIRVIIHNVPSDAGPTITATDVFESRDAADPQHVTFWVIATTGLNTPVPLTQTPVDDGTGVNEIVIDQLDLSNEGDPCVGGHFTVTVEDSLGTVMLLDGDFVAPAC